MVHNQFLPASMESHKRLLLLVLFQVMFLFSSSEVHVVKVGSECTDFTAEERAEVGR